MDVKNLRILLSTAVIAVIMSSCGGQKNLVVPRAVSTASAVNIESLNLKSGDYEILNTITESATVVCEYKNNEIKIKSGDGDFSYTFAFDNNRGWNLKSFSGVATMGYLYNEINNVANSATINAEEFARLGATAKLIDAIKDYGADGVIEPVTTTQVSGTGRTIEYKSTVRAKLVVIKAKK